MSEPMLFGVVTTIREPTACLRVTKAALDAAGGKLVVVGDRKGPASFEMAGVDFHSLEAQRRLPYALAGQLPVGHYARKNLGYLVAIRDGAGCTTRPTTTTRRCRAGGRGRSRRRRAGRNRPAGSTSSGTSRTR
jgi:hypothetical protein